ncbi:SCP2 sterol-binding domain-containing protein [Alkalihalobacterium elongatum]|uniref:SCP2 sterol-binding domain-containing protein n=1 Tax=Alkalihalobacterium elongatum TaxID=2675466 RepID=UPI001C1FF75C|nr:SCP2 sterol-binding domain-containing protein [Alkalihalobacterium elongatum]
MGVKETLESLKEKMNSNPEGIQGLNTTYQFDLTGDEEGTYQIKFENGQVEYVLGENYEPKCTLALSDANFLKLVAGKLNPTMAFMGGKLKIKGEMGLALKLQNVLKTYQ